MLSRRLWRAIYNPPRHHPLFQYTLMRAKTEQPRVTSSFFTLAFVCSTLTFCSASIFNWLPIVIAGLFMAVNTLYGLRRSMRLSGDIHRAEYDILGTLPTGKFGSVWAVGTGSLHQRASFRWIPFLVQGLVIATIVTLIGGIAMSLVALRQPYSPEATLGNQLVMYVSVAGIFLMLGFWVDHRYTGLLAILVGMAMSIDCITFAESRIRALLLFLFVQAMTYTVAVAALVGVLLPLMMSFGLEPIPAIVTLGSLSITLFAILREWMVRRAWLYLLHKGNADGAEREFVIERRYV